MRSLTKTNPLKEKVLTELKTILPYNDLYFSVTAGKKVSKIELALEGEAIIIKKGENDFSNIPLDKNIEVLIDIYKDFEDEIQALFDLTL